MKRFIYSAFLVLSAFALITGCSDTNEPEPKPNLTVTFDSQGGSAVASITVEQDSKISKPTNPTKEGFLFVDWFKDQAGTTAWNFETDAVESNITLYAKWTTVTFTVTFNTNGGTAIAPIEVASGAKATKPTNPTKEGYTFENWYSDAALTTAYNFTTPVTADLTLYAKWKVVGREELQALLETALNIDTDGYTDESVAVLTAKIGAANVVLANENATPAQLSNAFQELEDAIAGLVEKTNYLAVGFTIQPLIINDVLLISADSHIGIMVFANDATGAPVDPDTVTFTYDEAQFTPMIEGSIMVTDNEFKFKTLTTLTAGLTAQLTIKSVENPTLSKTITIKAAAEGEKAQVFVDLVNTLPAPEDIWFDDLQTIKHANSLYLELSLADQALPAVVAARQKLDACNMASWDLPSATQFSAFTGDVCSLTELSEYGDIRMGAFTYVADGAFPAGVYTQNTPTQSWDNYIQYRYTFKADGTGMIESKMGWDLEELETVDYALERVITKYTCEGTQAAGGTFYITTEWAPMMGKQGHPGVAAQRFGKPTRAIR